MCGTLFLRTIQSQSERTGGERQRWTEKKRNCREEEENGVEGERGTESFLTGKGKQLLEHAEKKATVHLKK